MFENLHFWDLLTIGLYFVLVLAIAWWASRKKSQSDKDSSSYFLAGKSEGWFVIGASLFASNIGSEIILGVSGAGARAEMPQANFEILASLILILLGWVFVPFYLKSGVYTMPEFLEIRYSKALPDLFVRCFNSGLCYHQDFAHHFCGSIGIRNDGCSVLDRGNCDHTAHRILYCIGRSSRCDLHRYDANLCAAGWHDCTDLFRFATVGRMGLFDQHSGSRFIG